MKNLEKINDLIAKIQLQLLFALIIAPLLYVIHSGPSIITIEKTKHHFHKKTLYISECDKFSEKAFMQYMKSINIKFPEVVFQQAKLESGGFKSHLFKTKHNLFGMKKAMQRATLSIGKPGEYAYFKSWKECVIDYALYQTRYFSKVKTQEEYINELCKNYAENGNYKQLITELCNTKL
jgi:uncharacterized FlgJ-related protein